MRAAFWEQTRAKDERSQAYWHIDQEDPWPSNQLGEHATQQQPENAPSGAHSAPDAERTVEFLFIGEDSDQQRLFGWNDYRRAYTLQRTCEEQDATSRSEACQQGTGGKDTQADQIETSSPERSAARPPSSKTPPKTRI